MRLSKTFVFAGAFVLGAYAAQAAEIPADWVEVAAGPMFTVKAPPGTTFERMRTGDAFAGTFRGAGFELAVEFGYHREELKTPENVRNAAMRSVVIDEKPGTVTTGALGDPAHPYFAGLHVPAVENDVFGPLSLVVSGAADKPDDEAIVERIYETVKFGFKN